MVRLLLPLLLSLTTTLVSAQAQNQGKFELGLIPGALLKLELSSGNYRIESGTADRLVIQSLAKDPEEQKKVRFGLSATRQEASVKVNGPSHLEVSIQIPKNVNLSVRLNGGQLTMTGIEGDKDIESIAGQVNINIGRPQDYRAVDASVNIGGIDAPAFPGLRSGVVHSFNATGPGKYRLHVHLGSGQIRLLTEEI
ncbi:MAG TPA: hypothetical protein VIX19_06235 [Terriglobales bacterium]